MFTGIVQLVGRLQRRGSRRGDATFHIAVTPQWLTDVGVGDSIAVNGVCLTVTDRQTDSFLADVSNETLKCTTLGLLSPGAALNLEKALRANDALGGHLVSGHVDAVGDILARGPDGRSQRLVISLPAQLAHLVAAKGNICVDGTSLTVNDVESGQFGVNIVPHTLTATLADSYQPGSRVNLEVDLIARYVARILNQGGVTNRERADGSN